MLHRTRVTLACFLAYCVMSGMLSPIGVLLPSLADALAVPVADAAGLFSWLTLGILLGSALALVLLDVLGLRRAMLLVYAAIGVSLFALRFTDSPWVLRLCLGAVGTGCGIGLAAAASTIALLYSEARRASMLVITDGAFSASGALTSAAAVALVAAGQHWATTYLLVAALAAAILVLTLTAAYPGSSAPAAGVDASAGEPWPAAVWLCIAALFCYTLGQYALLWWLPSHLEAALAMPRDAAGSVVSRFWSGMFAGQLLAAWAVLRIGPRRLVAICVCGAFLASLPLWTVSVADWLPFLALAWGVLNLGLLKVVIAFASLAVATPTPRLIAALLFGATTGTAVSPALTSLVAERLGTLAVLQLGSFCYLVLLVLVLAALRRTAVPLPAGVRP
jgi:TsgA-like MFS transporter